VVVAVDVVTTRIRPAMAATSSVVVTVETVEATVEANAVDMTVL